MVNDYLFLILNISISKNGTAKVVLILLFTKFIFG
jgi:hypothetical protein